MRTVVIFFSTLRAINCLNILVWSPGYGRSHTNFMGAIAQTLQDGGHNTILYVEYDRDVQYPLSSVRMIRYNPSLVNPDEWNKLNFKNANVFTLKTFDLSDYWTIEDINYRVCNSMLLDSTFLDMLRTSKFDLVVLEMFHTCPVGIIHMAQIPKILLASALGMTMTHYEVTGLPITLSNTPVFMSEYGNKLSFTGRIFNVLSSYAQKILFLRSQYAEQRLVFKYYPNIPNMFTLLKQKVDYILLNSNELSDAVRPLTVGVKHIGGFSIAKPQLLPKDIQNILEHSSKGVILFSLGSLVNSQQMPTTMRNAFVQAFRSFPDYTIIWKDDCHANISAPNIYARHWLPQTDLLAHPRVKVFLTHGGINSVQESLYFGVPMVIMPLFADQEGNAAVVEERGYGVRIDKFSITKEIIIKALQRILEKHDQESSYTLKAKQASRLLEGSPTRMREEILRVARISAEESQLDHLHPNIDLYFYEYYNVDVYLYLCLVVGLIVFSAVALFNFPVYSKFKLQ